MINHTGKLGAAEFSTNLDVGIELESKAQNVRLLWQRARSLV